MSKKFQRRFEPKHLASHLQGEARERSLIAALFDRWVLPGQEAPNSRPSLRLTVRDKYLNIYVNGQSVANISAPRGSPQIRVHWKYLRDAKEGGVQPAPARDYETLRGDQLFRDNPGAVIDGWIGRADGDYAGDEKRFVEHLVAANFNVIDLEMGLPGDRDFRSCKPELQERYNSANPPKVAPRMDIVVAVPGEGGITLAFWEAKLATNGELRALLPDGPEDQRKPHVCYQLDDYVTWLGLKDREQQVATAYQETAKMLLKLAQLAGKTDGDALGLWNELAGKEPSVMRRPGVVIANYEPKTHKGGKQERHAGSFGPYRDWLTQQNCSIREVKTIRCEQGKLSALPGVAA